MNRRNDNEMTAKVFKNYQDMEHFCHVELVTCFYATDKKGRVIAFPFAPDDTKEEATAKNALHRFYESGAIDAYEFARGK